MWARPLSSRAWAASGLAAVVVVALVAGGAAEGAATGLVAAYAFDEASGMSVTDASGSGNTGTVAGATRTTSGRYGSALTFDGVNDWVTVNDAASLDLTNGLTLEAWVYPTAISQWRTVLIKEQPGNLVYALYANSDTNRPSGHVYSGADLDTRGTAQVPLNTWTHLAATWDGATLRLYVNGTQASSRAVSGSMPNSTRALRIGGNSVWAEWFRGRIDEVRVYNRALAAGEVQTDMSTPVGSGSPPGDATPPSVGITSPSAGATVSGVTTLTASASDNVGVSGVQFRLDGANLGAEDVSAPYGLAWDTSAASDGAHTLTAVARDAAGNTATSASVGVTVANGAPPDQVGRWDGPFDWPLVAVHMTLLPTGGVMAFDGFADGPNSERVWNPTTSTFAPVPYARNLFCSGHVLLADGRALITGGHVAPYAGLADATLFDSSTNGWTRAADMAVSRWYPTATQLADGRVLVFSGDNIVQDRAGQPHSLTDAAVNSLPEVYDPVSDSWTSLTGARLTSPLYPFLFVLSNGAVFDAGPDTTTRVLTPGSWTWSTVGTSPIDGHSAVMYRPDKIMKSGAWSDVDFNGASAYATHGRTAVIDMSQPSPAWRETAPMAFSRGYHNLTLLPDGTVLATGGGTESDGVDLTKSVLAAEIWNPDTETWRTVASEQVGRLYHSTALLLADGRVLMAGGGQLPGSGAVNQRNAEVYSPPYLFKGPRPTISAVPGTIQYGSTFTVSTPNAADIASVSLIRTPSVTHAFDQNQRFQRLGFTKNAGSLTVTAPANANLAPPGYYMLFLVDSNGVPSVASMLRFPASWEDTEPPTAPGNLTAAPTRGQVALSWSLSTDNIGVVRYSVHRSMTPGFITSVANRIAQPVGTSYTDSGLAEGTYYYVVRAEDAAGNLSPPSTQAQADVPGDTAAPSVSITAPAAGTTVTGTTTVSASAADDVAVAGVQFRLDGASLGAEDTTPPYSISWNTTTATNGGHALTAVARDTSQNTTTSAPVSVTVSNTALVVLIGSQTLQTGLDSNQPGQAEAFRTTATSTGSVTRLSVYVDTTSSATGLVAGIYSANGTHPGTLLGQGSLVLPRAGAWNEVTVPGASVVSGSTYWIAILAPSGAGTIRFRDRCCGQGVAPAETSSQTTLTTLPQTWTPGQGPWNDAPLAAYGSG